MFKESNSQPLSTALTRAWGSLLTADSSSNSTLRLGTLILGAVCITSLLGACSSRDEDSQTPGAPGTAAVSLTTAASPLASVNIRAGDNSPLADDVATEQLQRSASINAARGISLNTVGFQMFSKNAATASNMTRMADMFNDDFGVSDENTDTRSVPQRLDDATQTSEQVDVQTQQLLLATLGLDASGNARWIREGNRINIDPDDTAVCAGDTFAQDVTYTTGEQAICEQLVSAMTVQLDAVTEQSGSITYLYNLQPLLTIGYGPLNAFYEVKLETLHQLQQVSNQLSPDPLYTTKQMQGAIRLTASATDGNEQNSGTFALVISEPLVVEDNDGSRLSMAPATLFTASHDEAAGTAHLELGMGAIEMITSAMADPFVGESSVFKMGGFGGIFDLSNNGATLIARNLGFTNGPLTISSSDGNVSSFNLAPFGYTLTTTVGEMLLDTALSATLSLSFSTPDAGNFSTDVSLAAPTGTRLDIDSDTPDTVVQTGGPLNLNYRLTTSQTSENGFVSWAPGSCQSSANQTQDPENLMAALFNCDPDM